MKKITMTLTKGQIAFISNTLIGNRPIFFATLADVASKIDELQYSTEHENDTISFEIDPTVLIEAFMTMGLSHHEHWAAIPNDDLQITVKAQIQTLLFAHQPVPEELPLEEGQTEPTVIWHFSENQDEQLFASVSYVAQKFVAIGEAKQSWLNDQKVEGWKKLKGTL